MPSCYIQYVDVSPCRTLNPVYKRRLCQLVPDKERSISVVKDIAAMLYNMEGKSTCYSTRTISSASTKSWTITVIRVNGFKMSNFGRQDHNFLTDPACASGLPGPVGIRRRGKREEEEEEEEKSTKRCKGTSPEGRLPEFSTEAARTKETRWHNKVHPVVGCRAALTLSQSPHGVTGRRFARPTIPDRLPTQPISPTLFTARFGYCRAE